MAKTIKLQYQVKKSEYGIYNYCKETWEVRELTHECDLEKSDRENLDDAFSKACECGADPNKNIRWKFVEG